MQAGKLSILPGLSDLAGLARHLELRAVSRWVGLGLVIGLLSGAAACALYWGLEALRFFVVDFLAHEQLLEAAGEPALFEHHSTSEMTQQPRRWILLLAPALGSFLSGWVVYLFAREAGGGNNCWLAAFHQNRGSIRKRVVPVGMIATIFNLSGGASAGREGPMATIGAALGAFVGRTFRLSDRERRLLLVAGAAGGIGAIFRTPLGGALFVVEVLYTDDFEVDALVPAVLSSVVAYSLFTTVFGQGQLFATPGSYSFDARELPLYLLMALATSLVGLIFVRLHHHVHKFCERSSLILPWRGLIAGLIVGGLALVHPAALGAGYGWMQEALTPSSADLIPGAWTGVSTLLMIAFIKVLATSIAAGSGTTGGVFGPSVVIGGMVGGAFGLAYQQLFPDVAHQPSAYMIVGMACFVGGVTSSPISTLVMASEMTGSYSLLVPTMLAEVVSFTLLRRVQLYDEQVPTRKDSPAHSGEYVLDVLQGLTVAQVYHPQDVLTVERALPLAKLLRLATESEQVIFPVRGEDGLPEGVVTLESVQAHLYDEDLGMLAIAADCESPYLSVGLHETLAGALEKMAQSHYQQMPVEDEEKVIGLISYDDLLETYSRELTARKNAEPRGALP
ncbi:MAG: chloride channel protein [Polyangiaceae bacterium]|nr:chloride channel protein [Polyangiaceae bacterium]